MYKDILRKKYSKIRKNLNKDVSNKVIEKLLSHKDYKDANVIFTYVSYKNEISTLKFIEEALKEKTVLVPYCIEGTNDMIPVKIHSLSDLHKGKFGILEPKEPIEYEGKPDLVILPGLAFSYDGIRLGYGGGFYDKYLSKNPAKTIGITYDELLVDSLPFSDYDIPADVIITPGKEITL